MYNSLKYADSISNGITDTTTDVKDDAKKWRRRMQTIHIGNNMEKIRMERQNKESEFEEKNTNV